MLVAQGAVGQRSAAAQACHDPLQARQEPPWQLLVSRFAVEWSLSNSGAGSLGASYIADQRDDSQYPMCAGPEEEASLSRIQPGNLILGDVAMRAPRQVSLACSQRLEPKRHLHLWQTGIERAAQ
jgi:hypothetical protein